MLGRKLKISVAAVSKSVIRAEKLAKAGKYTLITEEEVNKLTTPHTSKG